MLYQVWLVSRWVQMLTPSRTNSRRDNSKGSMARLLRELVEPGCVVDRRLAAAIGSIVPFTVVFALWCCASPSALAQKPPVSSGSGDAIEQYVLRQLEADPEQSETWRVLGRVRAEQGKTDSARACVQRALELDPQNIAAHFDLGVLAERHGDEALATHHFREVLRLGDTTAYAPQVWARGIRLEPVVDTEGQAREMRTGEMRTAELRLNPDQAEPGGAEVQQASLEVRTFDGADDLEQAVERLQVDAQSAERRWRSFVEAGLVYNSNVTLTPINQELRNSSAGGFQAIFNPELEWIALHGKDWRAGPLFRGFFNVNESSLSEFDLGSFQPGVFAEYDLAGSAAAWVARAEYVAASDYFDGSRIGVRQTVQASATGIREDQRVDYLYCAVSTADFDDDGVNPRQTSLDGWTWTGGYSHFWQTGWDWAPQATLGVDLEHTDTRGSDFQYMGATLHGSLTASLGERLDWTQSGGIGVRDYYQFSGPGSRDEMIYRLGSRLQWRWTPSWMTVASVRYDRFASESPDFDAERFEAGCSVVFMY